MVAGRLLPIATAALALTSTAFAADQRPVTLALHPGTLTVGAAPALVDGTLQVPVTVTDSRGNGRGWALTASAPIQVVKVSARCATNSTCTLPRETAAPGGRLILRADADSGMGVIKLTVTLAAQSPAQVSFRIS
jgi:hypothetical protein